MSVSVCGALEVVLLRATYSHETILTPRHCLVLDEKASEYKKLLDYSVSS